MRSTKRSDKAALVARRERRRAADRGELLAAAERSFSRRGYAGASIREIAAEAGFSVGGVYQLFPWKAELFAAVLDALWREYLVATRAALTQPTFAERLAAYTHASSEFVGARRAFLAIVVAERSAIEPKSPRVPIWSAVGSSACVAFSSILYGGLTPAIGEFSSQTGVRSKSRAFLTSRMKCLTRPDPRDDLPA